METYGLKQHVFDEIVNLGKKHNLNKIIIYGSRARGDYKERSDIDIAVSGENVYLFMTEIDEEIPTLLKFDVVNLAEPMQPELKDSIDKEGIVIYEKI